MRTTDCAQLGLGAERIHLRWISETPASSARSIINHSTAISTTRAREKGEKKKGGTSLWLGCEREREEGEGGGAAGCIHPRRRAGFRRFLMDVSSVPHGYDWDKVAVGIYNDGRAEFYRAPRKLDLCCDLSWRVHFLFFLKEVVRLFESDFRRGFFRF